MINGKRVAVVMPAYNAERHWKRRSGRSPSWWISASWWTTTAKTKRSNWRSGLASRCLITTATSATAATSRPATAKLWLPGADVVVMVHPDYQYTPLLITAMASMVAYDVYDVVLGSRIIGGQALHGGMPLYKYISNRFLTAFENLFLRVKLSEYHTGYRAFSRKVLTELPLLENSPDFVFDNQMLAQCVHFGFRIGEVSCPDQVL